MRSKIEIREYVASQLKANRIKLGLSAVALLQKIKLEYGVDINKVYYSRWENALNSPPIETMKIFCKVFNVTLADMYGDDDNEKKPNGFPLGFSQFCSALTEMGIKEDDFLSLSPERRQALLTILKETINGFKND